jgi:hypothetical protein
MEAHLLRAYLDGELDADAAAEFEILMLQREDIAEMVHADTALRIGLGGAAPASKAQDKVVPLKPRGGRFPGWWRQALAAGVFLAVGLAAGLWRGAMPSSGPAQITYIDKMRGAEDLPVVRIPKQGLIVLAVPVAMMKGCSPTIEIRQAGKSIATAPALADELGYAAVSIPAGSVTAGEAAAWVRCAEQFEAKYGFVLME